MTKTEGRKNMKKLLSLILAAILAFSACVGASAQETEIIPGVNAPYATDSRMKMGGLYYKFIGGSEIMIIDTDDNMVLRIWDGISDNTYMTEIGPYAFADANIAESIEIPETVKAIGKNAFENRTQLKRLTIYPTMESIGENAFAGCKFDEVYFYGTEKQFENMTVADGNEALFENARYRSRAAVAREMRSEAGAALGEAFLLLLGSPIAVIASPILMIWPFPALGLVGLAAPFIAIVNLGRALADFFDVLFISDKI